MKNVDFHDIYLTLNYVIDGYSYQYQCNQGQPIVRLIHSFFFALFYIFILFFSAFT